MPQVFQVLKCYKCSIFQVHQTKKANKWKCKVCGEKQSVKRHYGIGTAKECRLHVQKLNNLLGDVEESKYNAAYSDDSDYDSNTDNLNENKIAQVPDNAKNKSKWLAYVDKETIPEIKVPDDTDETEVYLELPQKRKIKDKVKSFKVPKKSNETSEINEIIKESPDLNKDFNIVNDNFSNLDYVSNQLDSSGDKKNDFIESVNFQESKSSKWNIYIADDDNEIDDQYTVLNNDEEYKMTENYRNDFNQEEKKGYEQHIVINNLDNKSQCKEAEIYNTSVTNNKSIFSLCDDNDLDSILDC